MKLRIQKYNGKTYADKSLPYKVGIIRQVSFQPRDGQDTSLFCVSDGFSSQIIGYRKNSELEKIAEKLIGKNLLDI